MWGERRYVPETLPLSSEMTSHKEYYSETALALCVAVMTVSGLRAWPSLSKCNSWKQKYFGKAKNIMMENKVSWVYFFHFYISFKGKKIMHDILLGKKISEGLTICTFHVFKSNFLSNDKWIFDVMTFVIACFLSRLSYFNVSLWNIGLRFEFWAVALGWEPLFWRIFATDGDENSA